MAGYGWLIASGLGVLAVAAISSGGSSGGAKVATTPDPTKRFTIKRDVLTPGMELSLSDFKVGDVIGVTVQDSKLKIEYPILVKVMNALKDGLDTLYTPAVTMADGPPEMHFLVLPRDVISPMKKFGDGSALFNHKLTAADVALGPSVFALTHGFDKLGVEEFILANPKEGSTGFTDTPATVADAGKPGFYTISGISGAVTTGIIYPWIEGKDVNVKREPAVPGLLVAGDSYGGAGFGGRGFGASVGSMGSFGRQEVLWGGGSRYLPSPTRVDTSDYDNGFKIGQEDVRRVRAGATVYAADFVWTAGSDYAAGYMAGVAAAGGKLLDPTLFEAHARRQVVLNEPGSAVPSYQLVQPQPYTWGRRPVRAF